MTVTSGKDWRRARIEGKEIIFTSGNIANIRPVEADFFMKVSRVPDILASIVSDVINKGKVRQDGTMPTPDQYASMTEFIEFLDSLVTYAFVSPKVVENPQGDDEISIDDISYYDKLMVYRFFTWPARILASFRQGEADSLAPVQPEPVHEDRTEQDHADTLVGLASNGATRYVDTHSVR